MPTNPLPFVRRAAHSQLRMASLVVIGVMHVLLVACVEPDSKLVSADSGAVPPAVSGVAIDASSTPTPLATREPTPIPTPKIDPHNYVISDLTAEIVRETSLFHEAIFRAQLTNFGGVDGPQPIPVRARLDGEELQVARSIEQAVIDDSFEIAFQRQLGAGRHQLELIAGETREFVEINVAAAELAIEFKPIQMAKPGWATLPLEVTNSGDAPAVGIQIWGNWSPAPWQYSGRNGIDGSIPKLDPRTSIIIEAPVDVPSGEFNFDVIVSSNSLESDTSNNTATARFRIAYDRLLLDVDSSPTITYDNGRAIVNFKFTVDKQRLTRQWNGVGRGD